MISIEKRRIKKKIRYKDNFDLFMMINRLKVNVLDGDELLYIQQLEKEVLCLLICHYNIEQGLENRGSSDCLEKAQDHLVMIEIITKTFFDLKIWNEETVLPIILKIKAIAKGMNMDILLFY